MLHWGIPGDDLWAIGANETPRQRRRQSGRDGRAVRRAARKHERQRALDSRGADVGISSHFAFEGPLSLLEARALAAVLPEGAIGGCAGFWEDDGELRCVYASGFGASMRVAMSAGGLLLRVVKIGDEHMDLVDDARADLVSGL